jgi:hypothetical protein
MDKIARIVDLAKNVMQLHGVDSMAGRDRKAISRQKFLEWFANLEEGPSAWSMWREPAE